MNLLSGDELKTLMERQEGLCMSIFMPTHRKGTETQQNQIRYKNLLRKAEEQLIQSELRPQEVKEFLKPAHELLGDAPFWQNQSNGLAVFISPFSFNFFRLPVQFEELVIVADRFYIKPLIPVVSGDIEFYVIAISQKNVRLLKCSRYMANEVNIEGIPNNLVEALNLDDFEKRLQLHTGAENTKAKIFQYFQQVDKGLHEYFRNKKAPLIFAGVDYLFPIYREANTYLHLVEKLIPGNPEGLSIEDLHNQAWSIVKSFFEKEKSDAIEQYKQCFGTGLASAAIKEIAQSSYNGRVGILFVPAGSQQWGTFNPDTNEVILEDKTILGNEDLLDFAAIHTLSSGGTVYAVDSNELPDNASIAAVFRY
jgi:hypothetical protein